jgi:hypothetical protein
MGADMHFPLAGVETSPLLLRPFVGLLHQSWMMYDDDDDCGAIIGMNDGQTNRTTWRNVRCEVFTAVTMKNAVFWDIKAQFVPHRRHITSLL